MKVEFYLFMYSLNISVCLCLSQTEYFITDIKFLLKTSGNEKGIPKRSSCVADTSQRVSMLKFHGSYSELKLCFLKNMI
jgi:hypothetical protein